VDDFASSDLCGYYPTFTKDQFDTSPAPCKRSTRLLSAHQMCCSRWVCASNL
jgi:hypothetical protein